MPAKWTGQLVADIHVAGYTIKAVAEEAGLNDKYVSQFLHSEGAAPKGAAKLREALERMKERDGR